MAGTWIFLPPTSGSSSSYWADPVATVGSLPASGTTGEVRLVEDTQTFYWWNGAAWAAISGGSGGITALTGDVTASGSGSVVATIGAGKVTNSMLAGSIAYNKLATMNTGQILLGNAGTPTATTLSGDVTVNATGVTDIAAGAIVNGDINASAAIDYSKLATMSTGQVLLGNAGVPTATTLTGDVTVGATGVTAISSGVIVDADINASAAIDGAKIVAASASVPGVVTTGTQTIAGAKTFSNGCTFSANTTIAAALIMSSGVPAIIGSTLDGSDTRSLSICSTSAAASTRGAFLTLSGNEVTTIGGRFAMTAGDGANSSGSNLAFVFNASATTGGASAQVGTVTGAGAWSNISGGSWGTISDVRLKTNVQDLTGSLDLLDSLRPVTYQWLDENVNPLRPTTNFIADEVELVNPAWVRTGGREQITVAGELIDVDDVKSVSFDSSFNAYLVAAIKELKAANDALTLRIEALENAV